MNIALLEDDHHQAELMRLWLLEAGYTVESFGDGATFQQGLRRRLFELLIVDWMLPDTDGLAMLDWVRAQKGDAVPVLFVTQRDEEDDIVRALEAGADDYMIKPVKQREFLARVHALARRVSRETEPGRPLRFGDFLVDPSTRSISRGGRRVELTNKEFELAFYLFSHAGRVLSRGAILKAVWGTSSEIHTRTVDTHISRLRHKLQLNADNGWRLSAVYQHGYRLEKTGITEPGVREVS